MQKPLQALLDKLSRFVSAVSHLSSNSYLRRKSTENKRLEEQLKTLSCAVEQSPCTIVIADIEGNIKYVNPKFTQLTGYTYKEAIGQNPRILQTGNTTPEKYEYLWRQITSGKEWHGEFSNKKKNGELYWESASISPVKNIDGSITHFVAVKEDITERKQMEEKLKLFNIYLEERVATRTEELKKKNEELEKEITERKWAEKELRESEEKFRKITSSAFETIIMMDHEGKVSFWNEAAEKMFGYSREEIAGRNLHKMIVPDRYYDAFQKGMEGFIKDGTGLIINKSLVLPGLRRDGTEFLADHSFSSVKLKGKWHAISIIRDITARIQAERRLNAQHAVTKILSESTTLKEALSGILSAMCSTLEWDLGEAWLFDPEKNVLQCAEIWHIASVEVSEFNAVTRQTTFSPGIGLPGSVLSKAKPVWIADVIHDVNFPRALAAEKEGLHGAFGFPILAGREVVGVISIYSREVREPDKELLDMVNDIGCRIGLFIRRNRAEGQIKASLKEKEVLLDEVHHRVKNNLQIISSLLDMSSMQTQNQETIDLFAESRNRVEAMALTHSQLYESERFDEIDMERHIQELSGNLLNIYSKEKIITFDIKSANVCLPVTQAVPCALVLNELISNSLKHAYIDGQQGIICISMQQNDRTILMRVRDDGIGVPEEIDIERTKSLGLKLIRNIVYKQLNGTMKVVRNKGAEFTIEFNIQGGAYEKANGSRR